MSIFLRSTFVVLTIVVLGFAASQFAGLSPIQSLLITLPIGFFSASMLTMYFLAKAGARGNKTRQLVIILVIELLLIPIGSAAAIAAYFM